MFGLKNGNPNNPSLLPVNNEQKANKCVVLRRNGSTYVGKYSRRISRLPRQYRFIVKGASVYAVKTTNGRHNSSYQDEYT